MSPLGTFALLTVAVFTGCTEGPRRDPAPIPRTLRVGYAQEPPYAFADTAGFVTGLAPELLRAMQPLLGVDSLRFVLVEFDRLLGELDAGRFDVIGAGLFVTRERAQQVAFTTPIATVRGAVLLRVDDPVVSPVDTASALDAPPVSVDALDGPLGVLAGAVEAELARAGGVPESALVRFPDVSTATPALLSGEVRALLLSEPSLRWLERASSGRLVARLLGTGRDATGRPAFATRRGDTQLARQLDAALDSLCRAATCDSMRRRFGFPDVIP